MSVEEKDVDENEHGADRNGRVRDIERPEVPIAPVHVHEIDDVALTHAVDEVAHRAAENQRQTEPRDPFLGTNVARVVRDAHERDEREARREQTPLWMVGAVQQPERDAGVVHVHEIDEVRNDRPAAVDRQCRVDEELGGLIQRDRQKRDPPEHAEKARPHRGGRDHLRRTRGRDGDRALVTARQQAGLPSRPHSVRRGRPSRRPSPHRSRSASSAGTCRPARERRAPRVRPRSCE